MPRFNNLVKLSCVLAGYCMLAACSTQPVAAWEKSVLAESEMRFDNDQVEASFDDHFYFSKEASSGGRGFSGGGCGCN